MPDTDAPVTTEPFIPPVPATRGRSGVLLPIAAIDTNGRRRAVNPAAVAQLADSIAAQGLITPILVRPVGEDAFKLVIGGHRIAAVALNGAAEILCDVRDLDDLEAASLEVDENLARHELDPLDLGLFLKERKAIDEQLALRPQHGGARRGSNRQSGDLNRRFTAEMADRLGRGERTVQRAIGNVSALDDATIAIIRGTPAAAKETNLVKLAREPNLNKRHHLARELAEGRAKTIEAARVALGDEEPAVENPQATALFGLHQAWAKADLDTRKAFLRDVDAAFLAEPSAEAPAKARRPGKAAA